MRLDLETSPAAPAVLDNASLEEFDSYRNAARLLKRGVFAAQSGDRDAARKLLAQVVALDPDAEDAWMWLASISDYPEELMAFLDRVLAINPQNDRAVEWRSATATLMAKTFVKRAIKAHHEGDGQFADECIEQALAHDVNCTDAWMWRASIVSDEDEQIECLERVLEIDPENADASEAIRQIEERREEERRIEEDLRLEEERLAAEAARLEEERLADEARREEERRAEEARLAEELRVAALFDDAKAAALAGDNAKALVLIHAYLASHGDNAEAWIFCSHLSQTVEEKLSSLEKALAIDPNNAAAKAGHEFLSSMSASKSEPRDVEEALAEDEQLAPVPELSPADETNVDAYSYSSEDDHGPDEEEVLAAEAITEESIPEVEDYAFAEVAKPLFPVDDADHNGNGHDPYATIGFSADTADPSEAEQVYEASIFEIPVASTGAPEGPFDAVADDAPAPAAVVCPFCSESHAANAYECSHCKAILSLSDLEMVLANSVVDRHAVSSAVVHMESDLKDRDFSVADFTALALGHLNLGSFDAGRGYLQQALQLDPNNVVLAGQLNALAIRLDEIDRQREIDDARPKGKVILVVDDSATVRKLISGKLEKSGHNVVCASDGVEALERMAEQVPDLVLLDITMPRMDGYEVCKQIRSNPECSHVPVVMISGKDGFFDKVRGRMAGTTGYVTKPFGPETLMRALETYLLPDAPAPRIAQPEPELEPVA